MRLPLTNFTGRCIFQKSQSLKFQRETPVYCSEIYISVALFRDDGMYDDAHVLNISKDKQKL